MKKKFKLNFGSYIRKDLDLFQICLGIALTKASNNTYYIYVDLFIFYIEFSWSRYNYD